MAVRPNRRDVRRWLILVAALLAPCLAWAQSSPGIFTGQVPTASQWNGYFAAKQDYSAAAPYLNPCSTGLTGLVPKPTGTGHTFLRDDCSWATAGGGPGGGNVVFGPNSSTVGFVATWGNPLGSQLAAGLPVGLTGNGTIVETDPSGHLSNTLIANLPPSSMASAAAATNVGALGQDLAGILPAPLVVGLYGRPIANISPLVGQVLGWTGSTWSPTAGGGGGGSGITQLTGDVNAGPGSGPTAASVTAIGGFGVTLSAPFSTFGGGAIVLTATSPSNVTLPSSGTLLSSSLPVGGFYVGSSLGIAVGVPPSGDVASISPSGAFSLASVATPGNCTNCSISYDAKGRVLAAASGGGTGTALPNGNIFVGNASNLASPVAMGGDVTLVNTGVATVHAIGGQAVTLTAPFSTLGGGALTVTLTGNTNVTLPTSGTLLSSALPTGNIYVGSAGGAAAPVPPSGDVATISSAGAFTIAGSAITSGKLASAAVTYGKMQNVTGARLLGNPTAVLASPSEVPISGNLQFVGGALNASGVTSVAPGRGVSSTLVSGGTAPIAGAGALYLDAATVPFYLAGCTLSNDGTSPNTVIDVTACATTDDASTVMIVLPQFTKSTAAWALGGGNGCLDTGSVANSTWYYLYAIERTDTGVSDLLCSTSTSPTFPANYTTKRWIGNFKTDGSAHILPFIQIGNAVQWVTPVLDVNSSALGTSASLFTLGSVPPGVNVQPICRYTISNAAATTVLLTSPMTNGEADSAPGTADPFTTAPGWDANQLTTSIAAGEQNSVCPFLVTDTSARIRARASNATTTLAIVTRGWVY